MISPQDLFWADLVSCDECSRRSQLYRPPPLSAFAPLTRRFPSNAVDPFADDTETKATNAADSKDYVHVRVQQRNGKKCLTTVQGLPAAYDYKKILKALKKGERLLAPTLPLKTLATVI